MELKSLNITKLENDKIYLKTLSGNSLDIKYLHWMNDCEIRRYISIDSKKNTMSDLKRYVISMNKSNDNYLFGIYIKKNNKYIGNVKLGNIKLGKKIELHGSDIGMIIGDKSEWGKGYATDAIACIIDFSFNDLGLKKLIAGMDKNNYGSYKAFINNGFVKIEEIININKGKIIKYLYVEKRVDCE